MKSSGGLSTTQVFLVCFLTFFSELQSDNTSETIRRLETETLETVHF